MLKKSWRDPTLIVDKSILQVILRNHNTFCKIPNKRFNPIRPGLFDTPGEGGWPDPPTPLLLSISAQEVQWVLFDKKIYGSSVITLF